MYDHLISNIYFISNLRCSSINGMIYMRGQREDYDNWAKLTGDTSWSWDHVLRYYKQVLHIHILCYVMLYYICVMLSLYMFVCVNECI